MPFVPPAEGGPLRRRISDFFFEHPLDTRRAAITASALALVAVLALVAWPRPADDLPRHLPFVTIPPSSTTMPQEVVVHVAGAVAHPASTTARQATGWPTCSKPPEARSRKPTWTGSTSPNHSSTASVSGCPPWRTSRIRCRPRRSEPAPSTSIGATAPQLEALTGIGPSLSAAILDHRDRFGPFGVVDDLLAVSGIGPAKLAGLRDQVRIAPTG